MENLAALDLEGSMQQYEIRVMSAGQAQIIIEDFHLSDAAAIRNARKIAHGKLFEVWKGIECISGFAMLPELDTQAEHSPSRNVSRL